MTEKQQIEEIADLIYDNTKFDTMWSEIDASAKAIYNAGYCKQREGEWIETDYKTVEYGFVERRGKAWLCTNCRHASKEFNPNMKFCPNCGAKMKGGAQE